MHVVLVWMVHRNKVELILWPFNIASTCGLTRHN